MNTEITRIRVSLRGGKVLDLTAEEARELHSELDHLFVRERYVPYPAVPLIIDRTIPQWPSHWQTWCGTTSNFPETAIATLCINSNDTRIGQ